MASNHELTQEWWENRRHSLELCVSAVVLAEASRGNQEFAATRTALARELTLIEMSETAMELANALIDRAGLPQNAYEDALHLAIAATSGMHFCSLGIALRTR